MKDLIASLNSDFAVKVITADAYWPKWNSPWWQMLLLHEMGETKKIPEKTIRAYIESLNRLPLKIFPIQPGEMPVGVDPYREMPCHCQLGNVYQVLSAWGINVDRELPWIRPWFLRYQMADGGFNCDNSAYLVKDETPSSMVGTIAAFEAVLLYTDRPWTAAEKRFLDQGAGFLIERQVRLGSSTKHNAEERDEAKEWLELCFPRFYFYDVLRGLRAVLLWREKTGGKIPNEAIAEAVHIMRTKFPNGQVRAERLSYEGCSTLMQSSTGEWLARQPATFFPLLNKVSEVGQVSPYLTKQWAECQALLNQ